MNILVYCVMAEMLPIDTAILPVIDRKPPRTAINTYMKLFKKFIIGIIIPAAT